MRENEDAIAIYSRKSRFTGKGESIGNQVELTTVLPSKGCWRQRNSENFGRLWFTGWTVSAAMSATSPA